MRILKNRDGSTMVDVLVAFLVITIMLTVFSAAVMTSVRLCNRATEVRNTEEQFEADYYKSGAITSDTGDALAFTIDNVTIPLKQTELSRFEDGEGHGRYLFTEK